MLKQRTPPLAVERINMEIEVLAVQKDVFT
jgi:hypothetical protein